MTLLRTSVLISIFCPGYSCITNLSLLACCASSSTFESFLISRLPPANSYLISPLPFSLDSPPLMERAIPDLSSCNSVNEWLDTIKMSRYKDHFAAGGYHTLGHVIGMNQGWVEDWKLSKLPKRTLTFHFCGLVRMCCRDIQRLGVTLMGHQKKIMTSVQLMRAQVLNKSVPSVHV